MKSLGIDIGSSSIKVSIYSMEEGKTLGSAHYPAQEMPITAHQKGWAEQDPEMWWDSMIQAYKEVKRNNPGIENEIVSIGISYQMHGLVCLDNNLKPLRPSIIWCDSRAVGYGDKAFNDLGEAYCLNNLLNSPGNFTASKFKWVKENEPGLFSKVHKICLPGDYISYKLTGNLTTTYTGLSEGIFYDFNLGEVSSQLMDYYGFSADHIPTVQSSFSDHGQVSEKIAEELGIPSEAHVFYKSGDQPNNAFSLNVLNPGEIAATAGTSGVVYGVTDQDFIDKKQRVNSFAHVNHDALNKRIGVLLCVNGTGIANSWTKKILSKNDYASMNAEASSVSVGSDGLFFYPFGNGSERMLNNSNPGASFNGIDFNRHGDRHILRSVQEGIAMAFKYGMEAFVENNMNISIIRAGYANMFQSEIFSQTLADLSGVDIHLYNTDGSVGAARGALVGGGFSNETEVFQGLKVVKEFSPSAEAGSVNEHYNNWKKSLNKNI